MGWLLTPEGEVVETTTWADGTPLPKTTFPSEQWRAEFQARYRLRSAMSLEMLLSPRAQADLDRAERMRLVEEEIGLTDLDMGVER